MRRHLIIAFVFLTALALPSFAHAATLSVRTVADVVRKGSELELEVFLDTEGDDLNAVEGEITVGSALSLTAVNDAGSPISLWVERPRIEREKVRFSGIVPGGLTGAFKLFTIAARAEGDGTADIAFANAAAYQNDGKGSAAAVRKIPLRVAVRASGAVTELPTILDLEAPESFVPAIARDPSLFEGRYFAAFATQDKRSGLDHFEVAEERWFPRFSYGKLPFVRAESPYVLADQTLESNVYVKAVDRKGNIQVVMLSPVNPPLLYNESLLFAILLLTAALIYFIIRRVRERHAKFF
ncbi:hypothetical protein KW797_03540 [Candidatus Parcubacteria bacterium]|nr:hypothetical protein [Candidatus Parcubacteria bacterium]